MAFWKSPLKLLGWLLVAIAGAGSLGFIAFARGETVNALWLVVASVCVFAIAYRFHSAWLMAKVLTLDDERATPARVHEDGKDYVRTNRWVVVGHHFAARRSSETLSPRAPVRGSYGRGVWTLAGTVIQVHVLVAAAALLHSRSPLSAFTRLISRHGRQST